MIRILLTNCVYRFREWLFRPQPGDVPRWTLRKLLELADQDHDEAPPPRRPIW